MTERAATPPPTVLEEFALTGEPTMLDGGDEPSVVVDGVVLKQVMDPTLSEWSQSVLGATRGIGIRIPEPILSRSGVSVVDGWTATEYIADLRAGVGRWSDIAEAGRRFHTALAELAVDTAPVSSRTDRWAVADRFAWGEVDLDMAADASELVARLRAAEGPAHGRPQIVHGDLTGNVLFDADDRPTVIDFSPLVRPPDHAIAIVAADAMLWHGADTDVVERIDPDRCAIARALVFRLVAEQLGDDPRHGARLADHRRVLDMLGW